MVMNSVKYYQLPNIIDPNGDSVKITFEPYAELKNFVRYEEYSNTLIFSPT